MFEDIFDDIFDDISPKEKVTESEKKDGVWNTGQKEDLWRVPTNDIWKADGDSWDTSNPTPPPPLPPHGPLGNTAPDDYDDTKPSAEEEHDQNSERNSGGLFEDLF